MVLYKINVESIGKTNSNLITAVFCPLSGFELNAAVNLLESVGTLVQHGVVPDVNNVTVAMAGRSRHRQKDKKSRTRQFSLMCI